MLPDELYQSFLSGDENALADIIGIYKEGLFLFLYGILGNETDAEEIMTDTFAELLFTKGRFHKKSSFKTWLYAIGRNLALKELKRRRGKEFQSVIDVSIALEQDSLAMLLHEEDKRQLYSAMQSIHEDYREVLLLLYIEDMSYEEVSIIMKKNKKQVANLAYRGKAALKAKLEQEGFVYEVK